MAAVLDTMKTPDNPGEFLRQVETILTVYFMPAIREQIAADIRKDIKRIVQDALERCDHCGCRASKCDHCGAPR